jgi:hypothetical protein
MNKIQKREEKKQVKMHVCSLIWKKHLNGVALVVVVMGRSMYKDEVTGTNGPNGERRRRHPQQRLR